MRRCLELDDVVGNAFIQLGIRGDTRRFISYADLDCFASDTVNLLNRTAKDGEQFVLLMSRSRTWQMLDQYQDIFEERKENGLAGIYLRDGTTIKELRERFLGYLPVDMLLAFFKVPICGVGGAEND